MKYTKDDCINAAKKCKSKLEFRTKYLKFHSYAYRYGWLKDCYKQAKFLKTGEKWTIIDCQNRALKYKTRTEWFNKHNATYIYARRRRWLNKCCKHMRKPWSREK